jgi:hypothetical protein
MKSRFVGALSVLLVGTCWAVAQAPVPPLPTPPSGSPVSGAAVSAGPLTDAHTPATGSAPAAPPPGTQAPPPGPAAQSAPVQSNGGSLSSYFIDPVAGGYQLYLSGDYLLWRLRKQNIPSAVTILPQGLIVASNSNSFFTQDPATGILTPSTGNALTAPVQRFLPFLAQTNATFSIGPTLDLGEQPGGRFTIGFWVDPQQDFGLEGSSFFIDKRSQSFNSTSINQPADFAINTGLTNNTIVLTPATAFAPATQTVQRTEPLIIVRQTTSTVLGNGSTSMWGGELNARSTCLQIGCMTLGGLIGFRYLNVSEELTVGNTIDLRTPSDPNLVPMILDPTDPTGRRMIPSPVNSALPSPIDFTTSDLIETHNHFYGAQAGVDMEVLCGRFFLDARAKIGVGVVHETVSLNSNTTTLNAIPGTPGSTFMPGGLLTGPLDNGTHSRDRIGWVHETNLSLGYNFTSWLRGYVGYDIIYLYRVARPSDQAGFSTLNTIVTVGQSTTNININQPTFHFKDSSMTAQGLHFGLELRY